MSIRFEIRICPVHRLTHVKLTPISDFSKGKKHSIPSEEEEFCSILPLNELPLQANAFSSPEIDLFKVLYDSADHVPVVVASANLNVTEVNTYKQLGPKIFPKTVLK